MLRRTNGDIFNDTRTHGIILRFAYQLITCSRGGDEGRISPIRIIIINKLIRTLTDPSRKEIHLPGISMKIMNKLIKKWRFAAYER